MQLNSKDKSQIMLSVRHLYAISDCLVCNYVIVKLNMCTYQRVSIHFSVANVTRESSS